MRNIINRKENKEARKCKAQPDPQKETYKIKEGMQHFGTDRDKRVTKTPNKKHNCDSMLTSATGR